MLRFVKLSCAGNDFVLLDGRDALPAPGPDLARALCVRRLSLGADGLLIVAPQRGADAVWRVEHLEPDGATTFCLNGTRGAAAWLVAEGLVPAGVEVVLETAAGRLAAVARPGRVAVALPPPARLEPRAVTLADGSKARGVFADVGNPQLVIVLGQPEALQAEGLMDTARVLRHHPDFPEGTNVTFVAPDGPDRWAVRTYERGVEGETLSCGSGILAAAWTLVATEPSPEGEAPGRGQPRRPGAARPDERALVFQTRSGAAQEVRFPEGSASRQVWARGPVQLVARGEVLASLSAPAR